MRFHGRVHGSSVRVTPDGLGASRLPGAPPFSALLTSRDPLAPGAWHSLLLSQTSQWIGCLRLGCSRLPPEALEGLVSEENAAKGLPKFASPDWSNRAGLWLRPVTDLLFLAEGEAKLNFNVNSAGQLHFYVNGAHKGHLFADLPVTEPLWLLLELFGDSQSVRILPQSESEAVKLLLLPPPPSSSSSSSCR